MRIWSIHPQYLDSKGLVALWREGLLARKVLEGKTKGYTHHPQLIRFKKCANPLKAIDIYLEAIGKEAKRRGYNFNLSKIILRQKIQKIQVTRGQIEHEIKHLKSKLKMRKTNGLKEIPKENVKIHPLFKLIDGRVEQWEKTTDSLTHFPYDLDFKKINFRKQPELYKVGKGEQGVLMVEPYKSEILPYWRFKTPMIAKKSAKKIYSLFLAYQTKKDFVGMDMARKFLQMGYTRSRRYANHATGKKYDLKGKIYPQEGDWDTNEKAESARIFYEYYFKAKENRNYKKMKEKIIQNISNIKEVGRVN